LAHWNSNEFRLSPRRVSIFHHASAISWFNAGRNALNASVSLAAGSDSGFPAWPQILTMQQFCQWWRWRQG
jgi:hypothetical protein